MKLGLFGGTFNPIHRCHLHVAEAVRTRAGLDRILFIPTGDPPHKPAAALAPAVHRVEMVRLAVEPYSNFAVSDVEIRRAGKSYTIDTVRALQAEFGGTAELYFVIGLDAFLDLPTWKESAALLAACRFVVVNRPGKGFAALAGRDWLPGLRAEALAPLDRVEGRADVQTASGIGLILLHIPPCEVSASDIRKRAQHGETLTNLLPAPVESYILKRQLYREDSHQTGG